MQVSVFDKDSGAHIHTANRGTPKIQELMREGHTLVKGVDGAWPVYLMYDNTTGTVVEDTVRQQVRIDSKTAKEDYDDRHRVALDFVISFVNDPDTNWNSMVELKKLLRAMAIVMSSKVEEDAA